MKSDAERSALDERCERDVVTLLRVKMRMMAMLPSYARVRERDDMMRAHEDDAAMKRYARWRAYIFVYLFI